MPVVLSAHPKRWRRMGSLDLKTVDRGPARRLPEPVWAQLKDAEQALMALPNLDRFEQYRATVQDLLQRGLARVGIRSDVYRSPQGRFERLVHCSGLDDELGLMRDLLLRHNPGVQLLKHFDNIRGILLDVFT